MDSLLLELAQILGPAHVSADPALRDLMGADIWMKGTPPALVASPATTEELARTLSVAARHRTKILPRGGGMSYTSGYTSTDPGSLLIDMRRMQAVIEISPVDMTVRVEAGATWKQLHDSLKPRGLRTPFWGPLSGISSTIGGGLSQNNAFFGAGTHGCSADSVLALTVVLADGTILRTDHGRADNHRHAFRSYGPDLTGLFLGDCGALGIKAEATLKLIPLPEHEDWLSFSFSGRDACASAMASMAREGIASELFGFDPNLARVRLRRASLMSDAAQLARVVTAQKSVLGGLKEGARIALAGRSFLGEADYSLHAVVEGRAKTSVEAGIARLRTIAREHGAREVENTIPKVIRANPFTPLNNILGPDGERWAPIHGIVSHSDGPRVWAAIDALFEANAQRMESEGISTGYLVTTLGLTGFLIEPVFFWPEERFAIHDATVEPAFLRTLPAHAQNPAATALVQEIRASVLAIFSSAGAAHFQIGRTYPYAATRDAPALALLRAMKHAVDPENLMNPGVLGL